MPTLLDSLRQSTTVVADTGDFEAMRAHRPTDATTNPSLILKAVQQDAYRPLLAQTVREHPGAEAAECMDRLLVAPCHYRTGTHADGALRIGRRAA